MVGRGRVSDISEDIEVTKSVGGYLFVDPSYVARTNSPMSLCP